MSIIRHNVTDALACLAGDFNSYMDETVVPDFDNHQCSLDNVLKVQEVLNVVRALGASIEEGDPQLISDLWLQLKPQVEV